MEEQENKKVEEKEKKKVDERQLYIIPSIIAACIGLAALAFSLKSIISDNENTCYYIFVDVAADESGNTDDAKNLEKIDNIMLKHEISGFTVLKNLQGGILDENGKLKLETSYQIILMKINQDEVREIVYDIMDEFDQDMVMVEGVIMKAFYIDRENQETNIKEFYRKKGK